MSHLAITSPSRLPLQSPLAAELQHLSRVFPSYGEQKDHVIFAQRLQVIEHSQQAYITPPLFPAGLYNSAFGTGALQAYITPPLARVLYEDKVMVRKWWPMLRWERRWERGHCEWIMQEWFIVYCMYVCVCFSLSLYLCMSALVCVCCVCACIRVNHARHIMPSHMHKQNRVWLDNQEYCHTKNTVIPRILAYQAYCHTKNTVMPRILSYQEYCHTKNTVIPRILSYQEYCHTKNTVIPRMLSYQEYCHTNNTVIPTILS